MKNNEVILGLGSNLGDRMANLQAAILELGNFLSDIRQSSIMETPALLPENAPADWDLPFYNMAIIGNTNLSPRELLTKIKEIEQKLGRSKIGHWCPRNIDIDILVYGNLRITQPDLIIPHPELLKRDFALKPLLELCPNWKSSTTNYELRTTKLVGILNITPDSFSDGGDNFAPEMAITAIQKLIADGADIVDIGAESTRPNATPISADEEWARLAPVLAHRKDFAAIISVDTRHAKTAKKALAAGADWINDVAGFSSPNMISTVKNSHCKIVVMHSLTVPADKNIVLPENCDVVAEILQWAEKRINELEAAGIKRERVIFDVGIGFGKSAEQSKTLINNIAKFKSLGVALFVGHSRKSFLNAKDIEDADQKTLETSKILAEQGIAYIRIHNVKLHQTVFYG